MDRTSSCPVSILQNNPPTYAKVALVKYDGLPGGQAGVMGVEFYLQGCIALAHNAAVFYLTMISNFAF